MHSFRLQLLKIQRAVYFKNLRKINQALATDPGVDRYAREYHRYLRSYRSVISAADLVRYVASCDIVYHGDYHTLRQSQRAVLRVLREIAPGKRSIVLCLEMFFQEDQEDLDAFMRGDLPQKAFFSKINFAKKWGFRYDNWKPVIDLCRERGIPVYGINTATTGPKSIMVRDESAAVLIGTLAVRNPGALIYVVDGDYHVAPGHLPARVEAKLAVLNIALKRAIIFQNDANLYWHLAAERKEDADVLQLSDDSFCIINTTPANKLQSYLNWIECSDDAFHPFHGAWEDLSADLGNTTVPGLVKTMCRILELPYPDEAISRLDVFYGDHLDFMGVVSKSAELSGMLPEIRRKIGMDEGFLIEYGRDGVETYLIYLPNSSLNMAAEEAAHFLNATIRGRRTRSSSRFDEFYANTITEAIGFFGSKLINERRKAPNKSALRAFVKEGSAKSVAGGKTAPRENRRKIALSRLILRHAAQEQKSRDPASYAKMFGDVYAARHGLPVELSTQLGYMLGNKLFYAVKKRKFSLKEVVELFADKFEESGKAFKMYMSLVSR